MSRVCLAAALALAALSSPPAYASDGGDHPVSDATSAETSYPCDPLFDEECSEADAAVGETHFPDPWERSNRRVLMFNNGADRFLLGPLTWLYQAALPDPVERAIVRALQNIDTPALFVNDALQLEWTDGAVTLGRFVVNSTIGIGGLFDPAEAMGLVRHRSDFGQTLTLAGIESGPYIIVPILGPSTVRDGGGVLVDVALSPLLYVLGPLSFEIWRQAGVGIAVRADRARDIETLQKESVDFYAAMRNAYYQNRQSEIWTGREHRRPTAGSAPPAAESQQEEAAARPSS